MAFGPDRDDDIPGSRGTIEDSASVLHINFFLLLSVLSGCVFLGGLALLGKNELKAIPEPVLLVAIGLIGFALFFPWFTSLYFARHLLASVKRLERRVADLERVPGTAPARKAEPGSADADFA